MSKTLDDQLRTRLALCYVLACAAAVTIAVWLPLRQAHGMRSTMPLIVLASTCYVLIALVGGGLQSRYGRFVVAAMVLCWLGDLLGPRNFVLGLVMFLVAHLALMAAFVSHGLKTARLVPALAASLAVGVGIFSWLYPHVPGAERLPVFAYMLVITGMVTLAGGTRPGPASGLILLAAVIFYISDLFVARSRFVARGPLNIAVGYPLYYTACILFAFSVTRHLSRRAEGASDR